MSTDGILSDLDELFSVFILSTFTTFFEISVISCFWYPLKEENKKSTKFISQDGAACQHEMKIVTYNESNTCLKKTSKIE